MNLDTFSIVSAVVHEVPHQSDEDDGPVLTDAPITLDRSLTRYFEQKIVKSLASRGLDVVVDPDGHPCVRDCVAEILRRSESLVEASKRVAERLYEAQTGRNPVGLLTVILGTVDGAPCVSVLKLEREEGLRFKIDTDAQGRKTVDMELLRELTLTQKTKVFKTSLLMVGDGGTADSVYGRVSDDQRGKRDGVGVASFYLSTFLGCRLKTTPEKATYDFVHTAERHFNQEIQSAETRGQYQVALLATMQDNTLDVRPADFARVNLDPADQPGFVQAMRDAGIDPNVAFQKDVRIVRVRGFKMTFDSGMVLVGGRRDLESRVRMPAADDPDAGVVVEDTIKRLEGR